MKLPVCHEDVRYVMLIAVALASTHCGSSTQAHGSAPEGGAGGAESGGSAGKTGGAANGGAKATGGSGGQSSNTGGGTSSTDAGCTSQCGPFPTGGAGCSLTAAAFCDTFDAPAATPGRAGELDPSNWSAAREEPQAPTANGLLIPISGATIPACRSGLPTQGFPELDTLICNANSSIQSSHLLVGAAAQNYGENAYRIRQPFDFAGRTGKIVFDAQGYVESPLLGWVSVEVVEDPAPGPSFAAGNSGTYNDEGEVVPRSGLEVQLQNNCAGSYPPTVVGVRSIFTYDNYVATTYTPSNDSIVCVTTQKGNLNHFEIDVSQSKVDVYGTPFSADGLKFGAPQLLYSANVALKFSRGYVSITTHNHATIKYSMNGSEDAWFSRWDNVGFDGPIVPKAKEYEIPDALVPGTNPDNRKVVSIGYKAADLSTGPADTLHLHGVSLDGVKTARIALSAWYLNGDSSYKYDQYTLEFRFNGGPWRKRPLTAGELAELNGGNNQGQLAHMIDVPLTDLVAGDNTLEFVSENIPQNYPPAVSNIDLILSP
jgi:hypothetical protein